MLSATQPAGVPAAMDYSDFEEQIYHWDPSDVLDYVNNIASSLQDRNIDLGWLWIDVRNNIIDVVMRTLAVGLFGSIAAATLYIGVLSKKWKDGVGAIILVSILPDCLSVFGVWLGYLSRLAQVYSKMYTTIADVDSLVDSIPACIESFACSDPYPGSDNAPPYSSHACVGTALMAADPIMNVTAVTGSVAIWLYSKNRLGAISGALLFVPLLAAWVSAAKHVKSTCWPAPIVLDSDVPLPTEWEALNPQELDVSTARLALLVRLIPLLFIVQHLWDTRETLKVYLSDSSARRRWAYWLAVTYLVPMFVNEGWQALHRAFDDEEQVADWPVLKYAFFSAGDALIVPLAEIYPGLALMVQRLWWSAAQDELEAMSEKEKTADVAAASSPSSESGDKKRDEAAPSAT